MKIFFVYFTESDLIHFCKETKKGVVYFRFDGMNNYMIHSGMPHRDWPPNKEL